MSKPTPIQEFTAAAITVCALSWAFIGWAAIGGAVRLWRQHALNDLGGPDGD